MPNNSSQQPKSINVKTLDTILNDKTNPPSPIIDDGILLDKTLLLIYGQPKAKKTFLCLNMGLAIAQGKSFAGFKMTAAQKVFMLSAEGGFYPTRDRIQKMCLGINEEHLPNFKMCFDSRLNLMDEEDVKLIIEHIESYNPKVLVIDPFVRFHSGDENSANEMSQVLGVLRELIEKYNLSVILVHHAGKDGSRGMRGSSAINGEYDSCIEIVTKDDDSTLSFDMRHVRSPNDRKLFFNSETLWFEPDIDKVPVVSVIKAIGSEATQKKIVDKLKEEFSLSTSGAYAAIRRALAKNLITTKEGNYSVN